MEMYRRLVGRLIYLSFTRPDLAYVVYILSQFLHEPHRDHWDAALRVVFPGQGILLRSDCDLNLLGWCDSDWTSYPFTKLFLFGWLVVLGRSPVFGRQRSR